MSVVIETTIGDITVDLYLKERPNTCLNFLKLCKIKYYNLCVFYKIEKNFIAQVGDPTATGRGGESIFCHLYGDQAKYFDAEFKPRLKHEKLGTLSMVNNGNNMNGSQFFLTLSENLTYLDENHTVFGEVVEGFDILLKLNDAICDNSSRPYQDIRITHTVILHDPFDDPKGLEIPGASPEPTKEMLESNYLRADEEIDDNKGKTAEEVEERIKESEAKARATILEMVGDIPDAEVKPPENVLFVCKLNPVTTSDDLEIIFSRFGKILSCEVIKDNKTKESLQYAFIEFEKEEDCEAAYFKMDNVLIDDRRIHVDFSQSVSKMNMEKGMMKSSKAVKSNVSLKKTDKVDGYDLIFDMENDISEKNTSCKRQSKELSPKCEKFRKKDKYSFHSEGKGHNSKNERYSYDKRYKNTKYDEYHSNKDKGSSYREREYVNIRDKRDSEQYDKFKHRNSSQNASRSYRDSESYRNSLESHSKQYRSSGKNLRYDSKSPDNQRESKNRYKEKSSYNAHSSKGKHSDRSDHHEYLKENKKNKSYRDSERDRSEASSHRLKRYAKARSSEKCKKSKMSSSSSSSSSGDSDSSCSSSSSSCDYKNKEKSCHQKQKLSNSRSTVKSQKKSKCST